MPEYVVICSQCFDGALQSVTDEWLDGKPIRGHWECDGCGAKSGIWMDGGTVDLDVLRDTPHEMLDVEVFTQCS